MPRKNVILDLQYTWKCLLDRVVFTATFEGLMNTSHPEIAQKETIENE